MPADFLSRNPIDGVHDLTEGILAEQYLDELCQELRYYLEHFEPSPHCSKHIQRQIQEWGEDCFLQDHLIWRRRANKGYPDRNVIVLPQAFKSEIISAAHGQLLSGHQGINKTQERIEQSYYWPNMNQDIAKHVQHCLTCQKEETQQTE